MAKPLSYHDLQNGQIFWLRGEQCQKASPLSYINFGQISLGEFYFQPTDEVSLVPIAPDRTKDLLKKQVNDLLNKYRIPISLLGPKGFDELAAIFAANPTPLVLPVAKKKAAKKVAKKAVKKEAKSAKSKK